MKVGIFGAGQAGLMLSRWLPGNQDLASDATPEAEILYLADKLVKGIDSITIEERFEASRHKCRDDEAKAHWQRRYDDAKRLMKKFGMNPKS